MLYRAVLYCPTRMHGMHAPHFTLVPLMSTRIHVPVLGSHATLRFDAILFLPRLVSVTGSTTAIIKVGTGLSTLSS